MKRQIRCFNWLALFPAMLIACCTVLDSTAYLPGPGPACEGPLGGYTLPKRIITATVSEAVSGTKRQRSIVISEPLVIPDPDPRFSFCLTYLGSPLSEDGVVVSRTENGLLTRVYSRVTDKSKQIVGKVLDVVGTGLTGNPAFDSNLRSRKSQLTPDAAVIASHKFDPFDRAEASRINRLLSNLGFCVYIEGVTFDRNIPPNKYCAAPERFVEVPKPTLVKAPLLWIGHAPVPESASMTGILYRPNLRYELTVKRRRESDLMGNWMVAETRQVEMPNAAPVFSLQVERSMFVTRKTDVVFDDGTLLDVTIDKPSELAEFVDIPLQAVQVAVAIPAQVIQVRINRTNNEERLIRAQSALIQTMRNYKLDAQPGMLRSDNIAVDSQGFVRSLPNQSMRQGSAQRQFVLDKISDDCADVQFNPTRVDPELCFEKALTCYDSGFRDNETECVRWATNAPGG